MFEPFDILHYIILEVNINDNFQDMNLKPNEVKIISNQIKYFIIITRLATNDYIKVSTKNVLIA